MHPDQLSRAARVLRLWAADLQPAPGERVFAPRYSRIKEIIAKIIAKIIASASYSFPHRACCSVEPSEVSGIIRGE